MSNLYAERGPIHVHVGATIIVEGAAPSYDQLIAHVEKRLMLVPRFRQRIVKIPLGIENPVWGDDPQFDVRRHVRHVSVPRPGRLDQLRDLVGRVMSEPLDMERPLWQLYLVEGLSGRHAYISKTHHALVDGVAAVDVGTILLDTEQAREPAEAAGEALGSRRAEPDDAGHPGRVGPGPQAASGRGPRRAHAVTTPAQTAAGVLRTAEAFTGLASGGPRCRRARSTCEIGRDRRVAWARTDLDRLKRARGDRRGRRPSTT